MRKTLKIKTAVLASLVLAFQFFSAKCASAAFNVSARPYDGGNDLRFGKVSTVEPFTNKELIVSITSDIGKRYQLIQTLLDPLTNERGETLSTYNLFVYGIRGSNRSGTINVQEEVPVSVGRTIIYTSDAAGTQDSFNLVYIIKHPMESASGSYRGRIAFTLEPIDSLEQPVTVILNLFAEISVESSIEIVTPGGSRVISLNSGREEQNTSNVLVDIKGNMGRQFRILQLVPQALESIDGKRLPFEAVSFFISQARHGAGPTQPLPLSSHVDEIYLSGPKGEADSFIVTYGLVEPEKQKAGRYRTSVKYSIESAVKQELIGNYELEVEIARIFDLNITPELGGLVEFRGLKPQEAPKQSEMIVEINSNIGKQFQVTQILSSGLTNKEGKTIPEKLFTLKEEGIGTKGKLLLTSPTQVRTGQMVLFVSDREGSSDRFKVIYELTPSKDIIAGDYSTRITYSISEI